MPRNTRKEPLRALFLTTERHPKAGPRIYRCTNQAKQLMRAGWATEIVYADDVSEAELAWADVLIFARCRLSDELLAIARQARAAGKVLCGELDDRIFCPWDVQGSGYLRSRATETPDVAEAAQFVAADARTLRLLPHFDAVLVSTPGLKTELTGLGIEARVFRNVIDTEVVAPVVRARSALRRILVMTGTRTHDADLRIISEPLGRFLGERLDVECTFLGPLELSSALRGRPNVKKQALLPIEELFPYVANFDLCLVPLEDTAFNDCKSALKFIECGLLSVPVLASPRAEFRELIRHRVNGFLAPADTAQAWYETLCELHAQPALIQAAAQGAYESVIADHTVASRGEQLSSYLEELWVNGARRRGDQ